MITPFYENNIPVIESINRWLMSLKPGANWKLIYFEQINILIVLCAKSTKTHCSGFKTKIVCKGAGKNGDKNKHLQ